jgi:cytochrome P450
MIKLALGRFMPQTKYRKACSTAHAYLDFQADQVFQEAEISKKSSINNLNNTKKLSMIEVLSAQSDDRSYIRSQILQGMMASQETTSALLGNAMLLLSRHPSYWAQLRAAALDNAVDSLSFDAILNSKMVQNILLETLRLYPIFPIMNRVALKDTTLPVGSNDAQVDKDRGKSTTYKGPSSHPFNRCQVHC